jgi:t-SNARE complex subunit (syntaxin)
MCLSDLLPSNFACSARMFNENQGRFLRDVEFIQKNISYNDMKCERVDPAKKRMLKEKFEIAKSYLGRFIGNILKHFTSKRDVQAVRVVVDFM